MAKHNILSKTDRALVEYILAAGIGNRSNVLPAKRAALIPGQCAIVYAERAGEINHSGTFRVQVSVSVRTPLYAEDGVTSDAIRVAGDALAAEIFDLVHVGIDDSTGEQLADAITAAANARAADDPDGPDADLAEFTVTDVALSDQEGGIEEDTDNWVDTQHLVLVCCPAAGVAG